MTRIARALLICCTLTSLALAANAAGDSRKEMLTATKVDRTHAELIALTRARGGKIKNSKIEREHGHLVWACEITVPGAANSTFVMVDAKTGKVLEVKAAAPIR